MIRPLRHGLRRLQPRDRWEVLGLLRTAPEHNAYLLGQLARGALRRESVAGVFAGYWSEGELLGVMCVGSNLVVSHACADEALAAFAEFAHRSGYLVRVAVGPDEPIARFMELYGRDRHEIRLERGGQLLYRVDHQQLASVPPCDALRPADISELQLFVDADLAMVIEELGFDPFSQDMPSFRRGWMRRIREQRSWAVGPLGGPITFKVDQSAVSDEVVQLAGVYTRPDARRHGIARSAIAQMCRLLLADVPVVSLYVHAENTPAIRLYESLGFVQVGQVRSVWFA